ncbi:uncharacterized protein LOC111610076 [Xiphophorus maculatus]|uniref:uncharacterized protein LOC111610076 n=1 Tax=Xiphophorus maculatus TaxID=8083 RepID=UPI000C6E432C|nr:uncharacterized protein LOC111610076 [Xiphophorus maculatus]XP_023198104.1 uncharacterized protein LOC111610076 [Xiphophorus maculatus]
MWRCKDCKRVFSRRSELLKHYKLDHRHYGRGYSYPCSYLSCACRFKTWNALLSHLSRNHPVKQTVTKDLTRFKCPICDFNQLSTERDFFQHIFQHLKNKETVTCVFQDCVYQTNIYENYKSHKYRKHSDISNTFKTGITEKKQLDCGEELCVSSGTDIFDQDSTAQANQDHTFNETDSENLQRDIELKLASVLLKLESSFLVSNAAIDELLQELNYLIGSLSLPVTCRTVTQILHDHLCQFDQSVIEKLARALCETNPVNKAIGDKGSLSSAWRRKQFYKRHFKVVEPEEYILDKKNNKSFQYVSILKSLQQVLDCEVILDQTDNLNCVNKLLQRSSVHTYRSFYDGSFFSENELLCKEESISLILYIDDFEICNPLGTSKRKHKICGLYWILGNLPQGCNSNLSSIYLAALIKTNDLKCYGYEKVLEPLLNELVILEQEGVFVSKLGRAVKGTVQCVVADNLAAHSLGGFVENFTGSYICRFCLAVKTDIQTTEVRSGAFTLRTKSIHADHLKILQEREFPSYQGVKSTSILSHLLYFDITTGLPPDIVHDLFEGVVPFELALCLGVLIKKKYFTLVSLNDAIASFNFKGTDKTNRPHPIALNFEAKKSVGGNAHENWSLIRFLPLLIGHRVQHEEPAWQILTDLRDIVDLVVCPIHTEDSIAYLDFKISEHRTQFQEVFPNCDLKPKHHFLEHYPHLIRQFGPLVALWSMRFEAKHSFFKRVARNIKCFKNVLCSLAERHQYQMAHHLHLSGFPKPLLEVTNVSTVTTDVLDKGIVNALKQKFSNLATVCMTKSATFNGLKYRCGMILIHGSLGGLPEFIEIIQMVILANQLFFLVRKLEGWYVEHYRSYELKTSDKELKLVELQDLTDVYPLEDYRIRGIRLVTVKRYIHV